MTLTVVSSSHCRRPRSDVSNVSCRLVSGTKTDIPVTKITHPGPVFVEDRLREIETKARGGLRVVTNLGIFGCQKMSNKALASPRSRLLVFSLAAMLAGVACPLSDAQTVMTTVGVGMSPIAVAVNPVTNKIYVANQGSSNVTVIDGTTNTTSMVTAGSAAFAIAVNAVTAT